MSHIALLFVLLACAGLIALTGSFAPSPSTWCWRRVALSQLVGVKKGENFTAIWNRYNRLTADSVICTRDFRTRAVLELDDRSHDSPQRQDADRRKAAVLTAAGIPLHRLNVSPLPNEAELRALLQIVPLPERAPVFSLRDRAR